MSDPYPSSLCQSLIRIALLATYPFLAVSLLTFFGLGLGFAFIEEFTVENRTSDVIVVTPVGTVGKQGHRHSLPVYMWAFPPIWSAQRGGFEIPPGESIEILYDMDDINFSEIVVHDRAGEIGQLVVNSDPTERQYHAPAQRHFVIDDLDSLVAVPGPVRDAARRAQAPIRAPCSSFSTRVGRWSRHQARSAAHAMCMRRCCERRTAVSRRCAISYPKFGIATMKCWPGSMRAAVADRLRRVSRRPPSYG
jgi:hypothetical protein